MGSPDQTPGFQARQVAADTRSGRSQRSDQLVHGYGAFVEQEFQDAVVAVFLALRHGGYVLGQHEDTLRPLPTKGRRRTGALSSSSYQT